jgi:Cof subfamily protein (haloacid dehalogenase superfamily)
VISLYKKSSKLSNVLSGNNKYFVTGFWYFRRVQYHQENNNTMQYENINLHDFKLIVSDIDGTLMGKDRQIYFLTKDVVSRLRAEGMYFTLATGKSLPGTISQADALEVDLPLILINGALLQTRKGEVLQQTVLTPEVTQEVITICEDRGSDLVIYMGDKILFKTMTSNIDQVYGHLTRGLCELGDWALAGDSLAGANKCLVVDTINRENLFEIGEVFEGMLNERADVIHTSTSLVEVMPKGVTKVTGIQVLAESLDVRIDEVMAFGDFDNDAAMLSAVGLGIAVENASPRAKSAAKLVIGSVEEQGPAVFLQELLDR